MLSEAHTLPLDIREQAEEAGPWAHVNRVHDEVWPHLLREAEFLQGLYEDVNHRVHD